MGKKLARKAKKKKGGKKVTEVDAPDLTAEDFEAPTVHGLEADRPPSKRQPRKKRDEEAAAAVEPLGPDGGDFSLEAGEQQQSGGMMPGPGDGGSGSWGWWSDAPATPAAGALAGADVGLTRKRAAAEAAHEEEVSSYQATRAGAKDSSDAKWMATVLRSGTTSDRVAAMTLLVQESPMQNLASLQNLMSLCAKQGGAREGRTMACDAVKELMTDTLLPDRKLRFFEQQPLAALSVGELQSEGSKRLLRYWWFEDTLKRCYVDFLAVLERDMGDTVSKFKLKAMHIAADLLRRKPEGEQILLTLLVNKIGDTDHRVGSRSVHLLQTLVYEHSAMKAVVSREVEGFAFRQNVGIRAQYYAVTFLGNLTLTRGVDAVLAARLIATYFALFEQIVRGGAGGGKKSKSKGGDHASDVAVQSRLMSALLTAVNRAFPYAREQLEDATAQRHVEALYRLVHAKDPANHGGAGGVHVHVSIRALMLLQQLQGPGLAPPDRFYRSLYALLLSPQLRTCRKQAMLLNLVFKAMKADTAVPRLKAFAKRLLQICGFHHPPFVCGTLFLLSELAHVQPALRPWFAAVPPASSGPAPASSAPPARKKNKKKTAAAAKPAASDDDIQINHRRQKATAAGNPPAGAVDSGDGVAASAPGASTSAPDDGRAESVARLLAAAGDAVAYDPRKREPMHAGAETAPPWELCSLACHFHPTVQVFAGRLQQGQRIEYSGDPLVDQSLLAFLERFMYKKPKRPRAAAEGGAEGEPAKPSETAYSAHSARRRMAKEAAGRVEGSGLGNVNSAAFARLAKSEVPARDRFFHHFFTKKAAQMDAAQAGGKKTTTTTTTTATTTTKKGVGSPADSSHATVEGQDEDEDEDEDDSMESEDEPQYDDMVAEDGADDDSEMDFDDSDDSLDDLDDSDDDVGAVVGGSSAFADADDFAAMISGGSGDVGSGRQHAKQVAWEEARTADGPKDRRRRGNKGAKRKR
jgi:ribosome biogenesis protein MAK21